MSAESSQESKTNQLQMKKCNRCGEKLPCENFTTVQKNKKSDAKYYAFCCKKCMPVYQMERWRARYVPHKPPMKKYKPEYAEMFGRGMSIQQLARELNVSSATVFNWKKKGLLNNQRQQQAQQQA